VANFYENFLIYKGEYFSAYFYSEIEVSSSVHDYFESCNYVTQASLLFLVKTIADISRIYDETKFVLKIGKIKYTVLSQEKNGFSVSSLQVKRR
jgi:hypothetical protein